MMDLLIEVTEEACQETEQKLSDYYEEYVKRANLPKKHLSWDIQVYSLEQYLEKLRNRGIDPEQCIEQTFKANEHLELRMRCFQAIEELQKLDPDQGAKVILFYAPPYLPHNYLKEDSARDQLLQHVIKEAADKTAESTGETFVFKKFFPYLADAVFYHCTKPMAKLILLSGTSLGGI